MADDPTYISVDAPLHISGQLFSKTDNTTPLFNLLGAPADVNHREFVVGADFSEGAAGQHAVSEEASRTAPAGDVNQPDQKTNVTQINHYGVDATWRAMSNTGELSGVNIAGQQSNTPSPLDRAIALKVNQLRRDMEYTIIRGTYAKAASKTDADSTRGFTEAISTNVIPVGGNEIDHYVLNDLMQAIVENSPRGADGMVLLVDAAGKRQVTSNVIQAFGQVAPMSRNMGGANVTEVLTDFGTIFVMYHRFIAAGTALALRPELARIVGQPVPGKGNYFYSPTAVVGAADQGQLYAQWGLDHGLEWFHGKLTGVSTSNPAS